jgi:2'-5' RNA ligase
VLWLGVKDHTGALAKLQQHLEDECAQENFPREERAFHPHLTIARLRAPQGAHHLAAKHRDLGFSPIEFPIRELIVLRSELGSNGSRYTVVVRHELTVAK